MNSEHTLITLNELSVLVSLYIAGIKTLDLMSNFNIGLSSLVHLVDLGLIYQNTKLMCYLTDAGIKYIEFCLETSNANLPS